MLKVGVIGIGNCGNQIVSLAMEKLKIDGIAINSSEQDLETIPESVPQVLIGDSKGAGKDRKEAKKFLKENIIGMLESADIKKFFAEKEVVFVVSSTGGGTGSGTAPAFVEFMKEKFSSVEFIIIGVLPKLNDKRSTHVNTLAYLNELYNVCEKSTYMLYDNEKYAKMPSYQMMNLINEAVVRDIDVIRGTYQTTTKYSSIDEKDMLAIIRTTGRIVIAGVYDLKEKELDNTTIDDLLIDRLKNSAHTEIQRDKVVHRMGVISQLSDKINQSFDTHLTKFEEFIGAPVEGFEHVVVNTERALPNNIIVIVSGLTKITDRIGKLDERIKEIDQRQETEEEEDILSTLDVKTLDEKKEKRVRETHEVNAKDIMSKFDM